MQPCGAAKPTTRRPRLRSPSVERDTGTADRRTSGDAHLHDSVPGIGYGPCPGRLPTSAGWVNSPAFTAGLERSERVSCQHPSEPEHAPGGFHILFLERFAELMMNDHRDAEARDIFQQALIERISPIRQKPDEAAGRELWLGCKPICTSNFSTAADPKVRDPRRAIASRDGRGISAGIERLVERSG